VKTEIPTWGGVAAATVLVLVAVLVAWRGRMHLVRDIVVAALRSGIQLAAVGAVLLVVFNHSGVLGSFGWLAMMVLLAAFVSAHRAAGLPRALMIAMISTGVSTGATLGVLLALDVVSSDARIVIPVGGMMVSNTMGATTLILVRIRDEVKTARPEIEARLALGLSSEEAFAPHQHNSLRTALIPSIDSTKVVGLISLPGAMTGLIMAGVDPLTAIRYQIVVAYMLLAAAVLAAFIAGRLAVRMLFDDAHRLKPLDPRSSGPKTKRFTMARQHACRDVAPDARPGERSVRVSP
jgi:putative ABC transport system permease protein